MSYTDFISDHFSVDEEIFIEALKTSPSALGYIMGAISEAMLKRYLVKKGYEVIRIKEKPSGGNKAKSSEARGDFYIRKKEVLEDQWLVVESKGLKSNSEFRGGKLNCPEKVFSFLKGRVFNSLRTKQTIHDKGFATYLRVKTLWEGLNPGKTFPEFRWNENYPGCEAFSLEDIWSSEDELRKWVFSLPKNQFTEEAYRNVEGPIAILETHQPSNRIGPLTGIKQAGPLVNDFNIMSVDLFLRTGRHDFVFMNSEQIGHSPSSPEHLYQNYIIDILVNDIKKEPVITPPWYADIDECVQLTTPQFRRIDKTQIDNR